MPGPYKPDGGRGENRTKGSKMNTCETRRESIAAQQLNRRRLLGAAGAGSAIVLAACSGAKSKITSGSRSAAQTGKPKSGGQLNRAQKYDSYSFDPSTNFNDNAPILLQIYESLVGFKLAPNVDYEDLILAPSLADTWETPDGQTFTFHLHPGAMYANLPPVNGRPFTSDDVKFSLEYLTRTGALADKHLAKAPSAAMFGGLEKVETPDASTAVVHFAQPLAPFLNSLGSQFMFPHEIYDQDGDLSKRAVGTGPFQLDAQSSQAGAHWLFKKNQTYFREGRPYLDRVDWLTLPDDTTTNAAFQTKQVDLLDYEGLDSSTVQQLQKAVPTMVVYQTLKPSGYHIYMNAGKPPFNDARVRKALSLAINRDQLIQSVSAGKGDWALAGGKPGLFTHDETRQILKFDPAQAKQLLTAAGYANGVSAELIYAGLKYGQQHVTILQLLQAQVKNVGINLELKSVDAAAESGRKRSGDFQLEVTPKRIEGDLDQYLYEVFYSKSPGNYGRINDPKLDQFVEAQRKEVDAQKRRDLWRQVVQYINGDNAWATALFYGELYVVWQPYVKDLFPNIGYRSLLYGDAWLAK